MFKLSTIMRTGAALCAAVILAASAYVPTVSAATPGYTSINDFVVRDDGTFYVTGTIPAHCSDVSVYFFQEPRQSSYFYSTDYPEPGMMFHGNGAWTIDSQLSGGTLPYLKNGIHDIGVYTKCGAGGSGPANDYNASYGDVYYGMFIVGPDACDSTCAPVHRFYKYSNGAHFYTANEDEKRALLKMHHLFRYEGISSFAHDTTDAGRVPVHRFYNFKKGVHFYTSNQAEATNVNNTASHTYRYEGVSYYTNKTQQPGMVPVHRFYNFKLGVHFYTSNQAEATNVNNTAAHTYRYEGIAHYNIANND